MTPDDDLPSDDERDADHIEAVMRRGAIYLVLALFLAAFGLSGCARTALTYIAWRHNQTPEGGPTWRETRDEVERILEEP